MSLASRAGAVLARIPPSYIVFAVLLVILWQLKPGLMNPNVLGIFARQVVPLGIIVLGQLLVMSVRSIDLSAGGIVLVVNYALSSGLLLGSMPMPLAIATCLGVGLAVGTLNGLLVAKRRASAVIVTLAVNILLIGLVEYLASGKPPGDVPGVLRDAYNTKFAWMPAPVLLWIVLSIVMAVALSKLVFGRAVASVGENPVAARFAGIRVERTVLVAHVVAGLMAAVAALVQTASIAVGSVRLGPELVLNSIAATILGGVIFGRGTGGVAGPFFGVLSFALLFVVMTSFGVEQAGKLIAQGAIILLAAIFYGLRTRQG